MIILYEYNEVNFTSNGLGGLPDVMSCTVIEKLNGEYELEMEYPVTGEKFREIKHKRIIMVKPNPYESAQPFRIYSITKPMNGIVSIYAQHISYDLSNLPIGPLTANSPEEVMSKLKSESVVPHNFEFHTDISLDDLEGKTDAEVKIKLKGPNSIKSALGGTDGSIIETYGGDFYFNGFDVYLLKRRGQKTGYNIAYGKNMTAFKAEEDASNVYSGIYVYWYAEGRKVRNLDETQYPDSIIWLEEDESKRDYNRILMLNMQSESGILRPSAKKLLELAQKHIEEHNYKSIEPNITVSFVDTTDDYTKSMLTIMSKLVIGDEVNIYHRDYLNKWTAKCIQTEYNALTDTYNKIELGKVKEDISNYSVSESSSESVSDSSVVTVAGVRKIVNSEFLNGHAINAMSITVTGEKDDEEYTMFEANGETSTFKVNLGNGEFQLDENGNVIAINGQFQGIIDAETLHTKELNVDSYDGRPSRFNGDVSFNGKTSVEDLNVTKIKMGETEIEISDESVEEVKEFDIEVSYDIGEKGPGGTLLDIVLATVKDGQYFYTDHDDVDVNVTLTAWKGTWSFTTSVTITLPKGSYTFGKTILGPSWFDTADRVTITHDPEHVVQYVYEIDGQAIDVSGHILPKESGKHFLGNETNTWRKVFTEKLSDGTHEYTLPDKDGTLATLDDIEGSEISDIAQIRSNALAGKTHSDITSGNPHNTTAAMVGAAPISEFNAVKANIENATYDATNQRLVFSKTY